jgi:CBS domain-containing protein
MGRWARYWVEAARPRGCGVLPISTQTDTTGMAVVGDIAAYPAFTIKQDASAVAAARVMRDEEVGDVMVVDSDGRLVGMLTDRDVAVRVVAADRDPATTTVAEVCTPDPISIRGVAPLEEAEHLLRTHLIHRLPVVDADGRPIGMVSLEDLAVTSYVEDHELRDLVKAIARSYQLRSTAIP